MIWQTYEELLLPNKAVFVSELNVHSDHLDDDDE